ncbi:MAG TPA: 3-hydroxyacyl-CoA dehydrogenase NAD-binding domain-containing protein [Gemmataceae bacterium]|jgi:3-hydroxyacyl-CoA dehydrogenase/enoyl-CoA hydratase/3-hydroxybutyryl-CoA epimerase|nr:3-hydroxyacyl-CoA dehydrogenase NAD-binding domain-containing protein [Gemmataceae bacterium]
MSSFKTNNLRLETQAEAGAVLHLDVADRPVNVFNEQILNELEAALDHVAGLSSLKLLGIRSDKPSGFMAGADLHQFTTIQSAAEATALSAAGQRVFDKLARLPVPTVAVIHGPCLGGGLEFALACDYRLVIDHAKTRLELPEIKLGLIPGWGGTQRLPRVIGLERALHMILGMRSVDARTALRWGLADALAGNERDCDVALRSLAGRALQRGKRPKKGLPLLTWRQRLLESTFLGRLLLFRGAERTLHSRVPDDMPGPWEALKAIRIGLTRGVDAGLRFEREAIGRLATTTACRNLVTLFFLMERARKTDAAREGMSPIRRVGVVGAGTMGAGIAQLAAVKGFGVVVQEVNEAALAAGVEKIEGLFRKAVERGVLSGEVAGEKLAGVGRTTSWEGFADVDLVIEAVVEELDKKRAIFGELSRRTRPDAILATNTSSLSVRDLQEGVQHPERVAGLHFFNPVHKMPLVEVVRAPGTAESVIAALTQWATAVGKTPVVVGDSPGYVVNRILVPYLNEAGILVAEGMPVEQVDRAMRRFGMPMGPLELLDQVGLDVAAHIARTMRPLFGDRLTPHPALEQMCQWGWLGQKSGSGFYHYHGKKKVVNKEALARLRGDVKTEAPASPGQGRDATDRMVLMMVNEAAACLSEGLGERADVIDLATVMGTGWAPHRGGPLRYADDRGAADVCKTLQELARHLGPRFEPCAELRQRAASGEPFYSTLPVPQLA